MIKNLKRAIAGIAIMLSGTALLHNCEPEIDSLGEQLFANEGTAGKEEAYDLIAYNISNNDTIRADYSVLGSAVVGSFTEPQFGAQKASYFTQLRMASYDPDFGGSAEVDSVVLVLKPVYETSSDSITTTTDENYVYPDGNVAAKKEVKTIPVKKYGKIKTNGTITPLTIKVNEVTEFMGSYTDKVFSDKNFIVGAELGSKVFNGSVSSVNITKDSDAGSLFTSTNDIRIPLDKTFFQNKIIAKQDKPELQDLSNFIRYFRGLKISVQENNGYLFSLNPNGAGTEIIMYYKYNKVDNGVTTKPQTTFKFSLGSGNTHSSYISYERLGSQFPNYVLGNQTDGDLKLFAQGMGGPSVGIKFKPQEIDKLKKLYESKKTAIITAKIRLYTDVSNWNNSYKKPSSLVFLQKDKDSNLKETTAFTTDLLSLGSAANFSFLRTYDLDKNPAYYDFTVTKSLKDIVEGGADYTNKYFRLDIGSFLPNTNNTGLAGSQYTTRSFATERVVFVGSDPSNAQRAQLIVVYGSK